MRQCRSILTGTLLCLSTVVVALPQSQGDRAHPLERYHASDYYSYNPQTLFDILARLPGITLGQQVDGREEIQLHGIDSRYVLLLINGQPLTGTSLNSSLATRQIPASLVARVDIDRNARGDLYVGGGGGGTINVILHDANAPAFFKSSFAGPDFSQRQSLALRWQKGYHSLRAAIEIAEQDQDLNGRGQTTNVQDTFKQLQRDDGASLLLNFDSLLNGLHPLRLYALYLNADERTDLNGLHPINTLNRDSFTSSAIDHTYHSDRTSQRIGGDVRFDLDEFSLSTFFMLEQFDEQNHFVLRLPSDVQQQQKTKDNRWHVGWQLQQNAYEHRWRTGLSLQNLQRTVSADSNAIISINNERNALAHNFQHDEYRISGFLLDRWQITPFTSFEAGVHMDSYWLNQDSYTSDKHKTINRTHWLPSFHLMHQLSGKTRLRLSISQSTRQPELADRIPYDVSQDDRVWRGNEYLKAETISSVDIGYEHNLRLRDSSLTDRDSGVYVRAFQRIIRDAIVLNANTETIDGDVVSVFQPINSEDFARLRGLEMDLELGIWQGGKFELGLGVYHSHISTQIPLPGQQRLPGQPDHMLRLGIEQRVDAWNLGFLWRWQDVTDQYLPSSSDYLLQRRSALQQLDLYMGYEWQRWRVDVSAAISPDPAVRWQQEDQQQWLNQHWHTRLTLSGRF